MKKSIVAIITLCTIIVYSCNNKTENKSNPSSTSTNINIEHTEPELIKDSSHTLASSQVQNDLCKYEWTLTSTSVIDNVETTLAKNIPTIKFNVDGSFNAKFCNNINGKYATSDTASTISLTNFAKTKMLCEGAIMKIENAFAPTDYEFDITKGYLTFSVGESYFTFNRKTTNTENSMAN